MPTEPTLQWMVMVRSEESDEIYTIIFRPDAECPVWIEAINGEGMMMSTEELFTMIDLYFRERA